MGIKYYESKMNLNWKPILKNITEVRRICFFCYLLKGILRTSSQNVVPGVCRPEKQPTFICTPCSEEGSAAVLPEEGQQSTA